MSLSVIDLLKHIRDELAFLMKDARHYTYETFVNDKKTILSYTRSFEIIGEACKSVPDYVRNQYPQIDWKGFAGLRDIIIHQYFGIDYNVIWDAIINEVPFMYATVLNIINEFETKN